MNSFLVQDIQNKDIYLDFAFKNQIEVVTKYLLEIQNLHTQEQKLEREIKLMTELLAGTGERRKYRT